MSSGRNIMCERTLTSRLVLIKIGLMKRLSTTWIIYRVIHLHICISMKKMRERILFEDSVIQRICLPTHVNLVQIWNCLFSGNLKKTTTFTKATCRGIKTQAKKHWQAVAIVSKGEFLMLQTFVKYFADIVFNSMQFKKVLTDTFFFSSKKWLEFTKQ